MTARHNAASSSVGNVRWLPLWAAALAPVPAAAALWVAVERWIAQAEAAGRDTTAMGWAVLVVLPFLAAAVVNVVVVGVAGLAESPGGRDVGLSLVSLVAVGLGLLVVWSLTEDPDPPLLAGLLAAGAFVAAPTGWAWKSRHPG